MHNKPAGTKGFGRTIRIHNTPLPHPQTIHTIFRILSHSLAHSLHKDIHTKADKNNSNMDSLINTTCFHKVTESAN